MKKIETLIKPYQLEAVREALCGAGLREGIATEVYDFTPGVFETIQYRGAEQQRSLTPAIRLEMILHDSLVDRLIGVLLRTTAADWPDDNEILVGEVLHAVRIQTGEIDEAAIA
jgi:nitrogen regulatory protein PII